MKHFNTAALFIFVCLSISGCANTSDQLLGTEESQVKLRSMQSRSFDTIDKEKTMRTIISTMQDLDFVIEKADLSLCTVTGSKFIRNNVLRLTVTVKPKGETQLLIRANAQYGLKAIEAPEQYQNFFTALEKSMSLTAHQVV